MANDALIEEARRRGLIGGGQAPRPSVDSALLAEAQRRGLVASGGGAPETATVQQRAKDVFGFKDYEYRGTLLPFGKTKEGKLELATPQIGVDIATSALLPGHVAGGGSYTQEDALRFALDYAAPLTSGRGVGAGRARPPSKSTRRRQLIENAPSTEELKGQSRAFKTAAVNSGVVVDPDKFTDLLAGMETTVRMNKLNPTLHPKSSAAFDVLSKEVGSDLDVEDLHVIRRLIGVAQRTTDPDLADDRRIAGMLEDALDDFVDNLGPGDVISGDPDKVAGNLRQFRTLWSRAKKSEAIEGIIENASTQASGFENGIRIGFRQLLRNPKRIRGFTTDEINLMKEIIGGTGKTKMLRLLGKLSFGTRGGSNFIGGTAGVYTGGLLGGPVGSAVAPLIGIAAQKGADNAALRGAELSRALAATGGQMPPGISTRILMADLLGKAAGPTAGTAIPPQATPRFYKGKPVT